MAKCVHPKKKCTARAGKECMMMFKGLVKWCERKRAR